METAERIKNILDNYHMGLITAFEMTAQIRNTIDNCIK